MESSKSKLKLKLTVDTVGRKVLFAEADNDVVDFLFSILALPLGVVVRLLTKESMVGCLGKLYGSVEGLEDSYIQGNQSKGHLLTPRVLSPTFSGNAVLTWHEDSASYYRCADINICMNGCEYFSDDACITCPTCKSTMSTQMKYIFPPGETGKVPASSGGAGGETGFVKGVDTYMVMDDLAVAPMRAEDSMFLQADLLSGVVFKTVNGPGSPVEKTTVELGMTEAVAMLKASLTSTTVLTDVFLPKK